MVCIELFVPQPPVTEYEIVAVPAPTPVTLPELFTVATNTLLLLHVPPLVPPLRLNTTCEPAQTEDGPLIVPGFAAALTDITFDALDVPQPVTV
jgi:hypothetical protein